MTDPRPTVAGTADHPGPSPDVSGGQSADSTKTTQPARPDATKSKDQAKVGTTMITGPKLQKDALATPDSKDNIVEEALAEDFPKPGDDKAEHFGEAGPGAEEVGKDTVGNPGANVGLQTVSVEAYNAALDKRDKARQIVRTSRKRIPDEQLDKMSPAEIRAVASDRAYELEPGGRRSLIRQFARAQKEDETLDEPEESEKKK